MLALEECMYEFFEYLFWLYFRCICYVFPETELVIRWLIFLVVNSKSITFSTFSEADILKLAEVQVYKDKYYDEKRQPVEGGLLDPRMVILSLYSFNFFHIHLLITFNLE